MSLQNRVKPDGTIVVTKYRGTLMGNRGVLHNSHKQIVKKYDSIAWITCKISYKNNHRVIMEPGKYTELFFLDEATSFSAGHRPCSLCRNTEYKMFKKLWLEANKNQYNIFDTTINSIDKILDAERKDKNGNNIIYRYNINDLPNGVFIQINDNEDKFYLLYNELALEWDLGGYTNAITRPKNSFVNVITPKSIVEIFKRGYVPGIHESAYSFITNLKEKGRI